MCCIGFCLGAKGMFFLQTFIYSYTAAWEKARLEK